MRAAAPDLRDLARAAERVAADAGLDSVVAQLRDNRAERDRPGSRVAIVGSFNSGKSTLVNRLLGTDFVPAGSVSLVRALVLIRALSDGEASLDVRWPSGATERRPLAQDDPWRGLTLDPGRDGAALPGGVDETGQPEPQVLLTTASTWLSEAEVELIDTPGLYSGWADHLRQIQHAVALADVVVMAVAAPAPLSLLERQFLAEQLVTSRVPRVIVVLTKLDQLPEEQAGEFVTWFRDRIAEVSAELTVLVGPGLAGPGLAPEGVARLAQLRDQIRDLAHAGDLVSRRDRRLAWQLAQACMAIGAAAQAAVGQLATDEASRLEAIAAAKQQLEDDDLQWQRLRLGLDDRRLRFAEMIRESVAAKSSELFEDLDLELRRVSDVKNWWERDLPIRLRSGLRSLSQALESRIAAAISRDLTWLDDEVTREFVLLRTSARGRQVPPAAVGVLPDLELDDLHRRRVAARIVTAAGGIAGAALAFMSGVGIPAAFTIGGSAIAGILAERDIEARTQEQRAEILQHLHRVLDDVAARFRTKLCAEADLSYQVAFDDLRTAQAAWRTARFEALAGAGGTRGDITSWSDIQRRADDIAAQIPPDTGGVDSADGPGDFVLDDHEGDQA